MTGSIGAAGTIAFGAIAQYGGTTPGGGQAPSVVPSGAGASSGAATAGSSGVSSLGGSFTVPSAAGVSAIGGNVPAGGTTGSAAGETTTGGRTRVTASLPQNPLQSSDIITFNGDGCWSWFQDERAIVDQSAQKLIVGSVATQDAQVGSIETVIYDLATKSLGSASVLGRLNPDDHNAPALNILAAGKYLAVWAGRRNECKSYYSFFDGVSWSQQEVFDWTDEGCPLNSTSLTFRSVAYSNLWYIGDGLFDFAHAVSNSPSAILFDRGTAGFRYYGRLTSANPDSSVSYYKYWGNNTDRIDFVGTEGHPRETNNNLWHGYVEGDAIFDSYGNVVDAEFKGNSDTTSVREISAYTKVFTSGSEVDQIRLERAWNHDIVRYSDGTVAILGQARVMSIDPQNPDLRLIYARFDGSQWKLVRLIQLGPGLFPAEQDFTGVGALHPNDPNVMYVSTSIDPTTGGGLGVHEIFKGVTLDSGATWRWAPMTANSDMDNIRPVVPSWDTNHTALLWIKGKYARESTYAGAVVGAILDGT